MILVTGATGYVGQAVMREFQRRGVAPWVLHNCDLRSAVTDPDVLSLRPDLVVHLAAHVPKTPAEYHDRKAAAESMTMLSNALVAFPLAQFRYVSSHVAADPASSPYAASKAICELMLRLMEPRGDVVLRLPGLFGLPRRSGTIYEAAQRGDVLDTYGRYPAMHVNDAAREIVQSALMPTSGEVAVLTVQYPKGELAKRVAQFARELAS